MYRIYNFYIDNFSLYDNNLYYLIILNDYFSFLLLMENEVKDKDSEMSLDSSSNSSKSSKQARVDDDTLKMGTEPIENLIPAGYTIHFISLILP